MRHTAKKLAEHRDGLHQCAGDAPHNRQQTPWAAEGLDEGGRREIRQIHLHASLNPTGGLFIDGDGRHMRQKCAWMGKALLDLAR